MVSKLGHYMYNNGLWTLNFPENFDPGHPPFIAFIYAIAWLLLGKTLAVSHFIHCCFVFALVWQLHKFVTNFTANIIYQIIATAFVFCDATILAQCFFMGQEVPQMFFFLLAINQIFTAKHILKCFALLLLSLCSVRGMMLCAGVFLIEWYYYAIYLKQSVLFFTKKNIITYVVASSAAVGFIAYRYFTKGYVWYHLNSQWLELGQLATPKEIFRNTIIIAHRYLDFGRIIVACVGFYFFIKYKSILQSNKNFKFLLVSAILSTIVITVISIFITNTIGHRYFAISFLLLHLTFLYVLSVVAKSKILWLCVASVALLTGNLWQYPLHTAQGWDANLKSLPYTQLRSNAVSYLQQQQIDLSQVGSFFPNIYSDEELSLSNNNNAFVQYDSSNKYVLYSNIFNLQKPQYLQLHANYNVIRQFNKNGIVVEVLEKRK